ncbi:hypothetical protein SMQE32_47700 (plasmid) [Serratia marcescens]|nr:hypothetical protein SMQE01_45980 [Serratia marcescens]BEO59497.1 hypothetical protein SMQE22_46430 [Serratia marcescens]BEO73951.1 hypothetical protein SMQE32_47700 [Serratia marcescens]
MYKLSTLADGDIYDLTLYTIQHVGLIQAKHCHEGITKIFELQAKNPELGTECPCFCQGMGAFNTKSMGYSFLKKGRKL